MAAIDIPLDDFIKMKKIRGSGRGGGNPNRRRGGHPGGGGGGFRSGGGRNAGGRSSGGYSSSRPRNSYVDLDDPQVFAVPSGVSFNKTVRINISNLAPTVISEDLEELFQSYSIESATVHYNESGASLGTGDIFLKKRDAERLVKEFAGVALDNQVMKFLLVDAAESLVSRVDFSGRVSGGIQKRTSQPYSRGGGDRRGPRSGGFRGNRPQGGGGGRQNGTGRRREERPKKTQEELDAELDAYMAKKSG